MTANPVMLTVSRASGQLLWTSIAAVHTDLGPDVLRMLTDACCEADLVQRLEDQLRDSPLMVVGSQGQLVASPLVSEVRQHRAVLASLLKSLKLPMTAGDAKRAEQTASEQARQAARTRWDKPKLVAG